MKLYAVALFSFCFSASAYISPVPSITGTAWVGYHDSTCVFVRNNTTYTDPAADATCGFTEVYNSNMGTVTSYLSGSDKLPGIVFTPVAGAAYFVKVSFTMGNTGAGYNKAQLVDGATVLDQNSNPGTSTNPQFTQLSGVVYAADTTAKTIAIQAAATAASTNIGPHSTPATRALNWTIYRIF